MRTDQGTLGFPVHEVSLDVAIQQLRKASLNAPLAHPQSIEVGFVLTLERRAVASSLRVKLAAAWVERAMPLRKP